MSGREGKASALDKRLESCEYLCESLWKVIDTSLCDLWVIQEKIRILSREKAGLEKGKADGG